MLFYSVGRWSDEGRTTYYLEWEAALAKVQAKLNIIPQEACVEIVAKAKVENIDFEKLKQKTELIGYPVLGVVQQIVSLCRDGLGEWCHWGATTQDVTDTATVMAIRDSFDIIEADLDHIMGSVAQLAEDHRLTPSESSQPLYCMPSTDEKWLRIVLSIYHVESTHYKVIRRNSPCYR